MSGAVLPPGETVRLMRARVVCTVQRELGQGGQGSVYEVTTDTGHGYALKWYAPRFATTGQRQAIEQLADQGPPSDSFLWPLEIAESTARPSFGYVMPLRPPRFHGLNELLRGRLEDVTFRALATTGLELADNFHELHSRGLCYRDISPGNVFFDPRDGTVLICDNDNVGINGLAPPGIMGTPRFMAPEIVRHEALPTTATDLYSLAVLLFHLLMVGHPLIGRRELDFPCWDAEAEAAMFGHDPRFAFDPEDASNRPIAGEHDAVVRYWELYPQAIRDLFVRAFGEGLHDPLHGRVGETEWRHAMIQMRDAITFCRCGAENFFDVGAPAGQEVGACWHCGRTLPPPVRLHLRRGVVVLNHDAVLYPHHLDVARSQDFSAPAASVVRHPSQERWGLRNDSGRPWVAVDRAGTTHTIAPGRTVGLIRGLRIRFSGIEAEVRT